MTASFPFESEKPLPEGDQSSSTVQRHYDNRPNQDVQSRRHSPIYHLRAFNNWVKAVQISEGTQGRRHLRILDLACGKGGDLGKWRRSQAVEAYYGLDIASVSIDHARSRLDDIRPPFPVTLLAADAFRRPLPSDIPRALFDIVACQFALHYAFESERILEQALRNVSDALQPGGLFIGTMADGDAIRKTSVRENSVFRITFPSLDLNSVFGCQYVFHLIDAIDDCPEYLSNRHVLEDMAGAANLELVYYLPFKDFYLAHAPRHLQLLRHMDVVHPNDGSLALSADELPVAELYAAFCFRKFS
jgi:mRNA (guanine-N7-)-methyltransferase